jgi:hyaluronan synthase
MGTLAVHTDIRRWCEGSLKGPAVTELNWPSALGESVRKLGYSAVDLNGVAGRKIPWFDLALKTTLVGCYSLVIYLAITTGSLFNSFDEVYETRIGSFLMYGALAYSSLMMFVTLVRALMVMKYRPTPSARDEELPFVTVIIPAYNEGAGVAKSIDSIARSNYPAHKLQIIAINDGSKDDTWQHIDTMGRRYPDNVCAINMEKNGGKRQGLRVGFAMAAGEVLVTMDSDSTVERDALRNLVTPLVQDDRIGAVAGNVKVLNRDEGIIPRMLRASFVLAFDFTRAYQSQIRTVQCTPGAFSAYRATAVEAVLAEWNNQTWMGKPSTIAEDRALSNLILRDGHEITFQGNATAWTNVPLTYKGLAKMFMRWERGNVRENLTYLSFCWKPFRKRYWLHANVDFALNSLEMVIPYLLIVASLGYSIFNPFFGLKYLAFVIIVSTCMQAYYYKQERNTDFLYGILYSIFWFTVMWWVVPYSILTANNGKWGTRTLPGEVEQVHGVDAPATETWPAPARIAA